MEATYEQQPYFHPSILCDHESLVDAKQYQSPYQILAEFIQYIIIKNNLHSFTAEEMKKQSF